MFERVIAKDLKLVFPQLYMAEELFQLIEENRDFLRAWLPWLDQSESVEDTRAFLKTAISQVANENGMQCVIVFKGSIAGMVGYHNIDNQTKVGQIGYWLSEAVNGKGIMTQCVKELITAGFVILELKKVEIHCAVNNTRSRAIPEKLSMKQEGIIRRAENLYGRFVDHVVYGILDTEWRVAHT
jgi:ribosomal-protein-serine acetyltransferase